MKHYVTLLFLPFFAVFALHGPSLAAHAKQPNILLIVSEDNGPELGCYDDPYAHIPTILFPPAGPV
jgi:N-sulfoglucosamine sulfohydrolase